ncbi:MAG: FlgD immunoglobulin-like domain containing protein [Candidatus Krumholzibacteriaceae bacterium]
MRMTFKTVALLCLVLSLGLPSSGQAQWRQNGVPIAALAGVQDESQIVGDGYGGAYIVWRDYRNSAQADIYIQRVNARGEIAWTDGGIAVASGPSQQTNPCICLDSSGNAIVAYNDNASGNIDIYAQCVNRVGTLLWGAGGVAVCTETSNQGAPHIVAGTSGSSIVGWMDSRSGNQHVYAQRLSSAGIIQWTAPGVVICNAANTQDDMQMIPDGSGGAIFVWEDYRDATNYLVYAQKINVGAIVQWMVNGVRLCTGNYWQNQPKLISDGAGGAIVVWYDLRNGTDDDIYAQRILSTGSLGWNPIGKYVCATTGEQTWPDLATDGAGGAFLTWTDARTSPPYTDVYAQHLNSSGTAQWGVGGVAVSDPAGNQNFPVIVSDGAGGAIITWQDTRLGNDYGVYAQRIDGTGAPQWLMQGAEVSDPVNTQWQPHIISDGAQGAIICWTDLRDQATQSYDVYAQRMEEFGNWGYPAPHINSGIDVPHDQGGKVLLTWDPSYLDAFPQQAINRYTIWRSTDGHSYAPLDSIDAYSLPGYQYAAATTADSSGSGEAPQWFKIRAIAWGVNTWWESNVWRCHSVDNLSPTPPTALVAEQKFEPAGLQLTWTPNPELDLAHYAVYRGTSAGFSPGADNLLASPTEASCFDGEWRWGSGYYYKVSAIDAHGNESGFATAAPDYVSGVEGSEAPRATYLAQNFPNPFNPATKITFGLKGPGGVSLRIYDATGRLVRVLVKGDLSAGRYAEPWDGKDNGGRAVASGIYFYRLDAGTFTQTRKMVLLR